MGSRPPQGWFPGHHWDDYRAGKGAGAGFISQSLPAGSGGTLVNPRLPFQSNIYCIHRGWDPESGLTQCVASGKSPPPCFLIWKMEMIISTRWGPCEGLMGLAGWESVFQPRGARGGREQVLDPIRLGSEFSSTSSQLCDLTQVSQPLRASISSPGKYG